MRLPLQAVTDPDRPACTGTGGDLEAGTAGSSTAGGSVTAGQQAPPDRRQAPLDREQASFDREQGDSDLDEGWLGQDPVHEDEQSSAEGGQGQGQQQGLAEQAQQLTFGSPQAELLVARGLEAGLRKEQSGLSTASGATGSSRRPRKEQSGPSGSNLGLAAAPNGARGNSRGLRQQQAGRSDASGAGRGGERRLGDEEQRSSSIDRHQDKERQEDVLTTGQSSEVCSRGGGIQRSCCPPLITDTQHRWASWHLAGLMCLLRGEVITQQRGRDSRQQLDDVLISGQRQTWQGYASAQSPLPDLSGSSDRTRCLPLGQSSTVQPVGRLDLAP